MRRVTIFAGIVLCFFLTMLAQEAPPAVGGPLMAVAGGNERVITLEECVQLALKHNFDIKIQEMSPQLVGYDLRGAYGAYDPTFRFTAQHRFSSSEGGFDAQGRQFSNSERESDSLSPGLGGVLPTGLTYDLSADLSKQEGFSQGVGGPSPFSFHDGSAGVFTMSQPFLRDSWIDSTRLNIKVLKKDLQISELQFRFTVMDIVTQVELAYYEYMFALTNIVVAQDALRLAERSVFEVKKKVEVGQLAELEQKSADSQVARARADLITAEFNSKTRQNALKALITDNYAELHPVKLLPGEPLEVRPREFDLGDTWLEALSKRPDYKQQLLALDKANIRLKFSRNQLFPWFDAFGSYGHAGLGAYEGQVLDDLRRGNTPQYGYGLRLRFPLSFRSERNAYKAAKVTLEQEKIRVNQLEQFIMVEIDNAVNALTSSFDSITANRSARFFAEAALEAEQKKFENGKSTTFDVLQFQRDLTAARRDEIRSLVDYNQALVDLEFKRGTTLEKRGISVGVE